MIEPIQGDVESEKNQFENEQKLPEKIKASDISEKSSNLEKSIKFNENAEVIQKNFNEDDNSSIESTSKL